MMFGKLNIYMQKNETEPLSYTTYKMVKELNINPGTIKLREQKIGGKNLLGTDLGNDYLFVWLWHQKHRQKQTNGRKYL